jgi:hypothetical protein
MPALYQDQLCAAEWTVLESIYQLITSFIMGKDLFDSYLSSPHQKWLPLRVLTARASPAPRLRRNHLQHQTNHKARMAAADQPRQQRRVEALVRRCR